MKRKNLLLLLIGTLLFTCHLLPQTQQTTLYNDGMIIAQIESATSNVETIKANIGDSYIFDNMEWLILEIQDNKILIITKNIIGTRRFDAISNVWENSEIRRYLNGDFFNSINVTNRSKIVPHSTGDNIFLLSLEEVYQYVYSSNKESRRIITDQIDWWWLRSPHYGHGVYNVYSVGDNGDVWNYSYDTESGGVRPALWLNL